MTPDLNLRINKNGKILQRPVVAFAEPPFALARRIARAAQGKRHLASWLASVVVWDAYVNTIIPKEEQGSHRVLRLMRGYRHKQCLSRDDELCQAMIRFGYEEKYSKFRSRPENYGHQPAYRRGPQFRFKLLKDFEITKKPHAIRGAE
jgi:hypothetical protein